MLNTHCGATVLGDVMYSWILSCCITGVAIVYIRCTIYVTVMFIYACFAIQFKPLSI